MMAEQEKRRKCAGCISCTCVYHGPSLCHFALLQNSVHTYCTCISLLKQLQRLWLSPLLNGDKGEQVLHVPLLQLSGRPDPRKTTTYANDWTRGKDSTAKFGMTRTTGQGQLFVFFVLRRTYGRQHIYLEQNVTARSPWKGKFLTQICCWKFSYSVCPLYRTLVQRCSFRDFVLYWSTEACLERSGVGKKKEKKKACSEMVGK